jgi:hypothetical protein
LGSIAGVLIADYWFVRKRQLALEDLYLPNGVYRYNQGWNWNAVFATVAGCALAWGGLVIPLLKPLYSYAWFVGFLVAGGVYYALEARRAPVVPGQLVVILSEEKDLLVRQLEKSRSFVAPLFSMTCSSITFPWFPLRPLR